MAPKREVSVVAGTIGHMPHVADPGATIELVESGRVVTLAHLDQELTYGGLIEGVPTPDLNRRMLARHERNYARHDRPLMIISPTQRPISGLTTSTGAPAIAMPTITVRAKFSTVDPIDYNTDADGSHLTVLWYQDAWAFPISSEVLERLQNIDWNSAAADFRW